ncbi:MAG TPA: hypothetical protein VD766_00340 [Solirubrobacterales bacterium]|nr:hypothetical protein [Solirubrobacterales bacterium]
MSVLATVVDWSALGQTVLAALLSGVGVAFTFSLGILGVARFTDGSRELGVLGTIAFGLLALFGMVATVAAIVFGVIVMTSG